MITVNGNFTMNDGLAWDIDTHEILSALIVEAGVHCKYNASDVLDIWDTVRSRLSGNDVFDAEGIDVLYFGFYPFGVHGTEDVKMCLKEDEFGTYGYDSVCKLIVYRTCGEITMELRKLSNAEIVELQAV